MRAFGRIGIGCAQAALLVSVAFAPQDVRAQALTPQQALGKMIVPEGFEVRLFSSEPQIRQPVSMTFDSRGRMWVVQYLQYPHPEGLKPVSVDRYLRTKYDKVPEPPPRGAKGADKITICEDTDGDGRADKFKDFVTGLNLATGVETCDGPEAGVFVLQTPYLLFYRANKEFDAPVGDPEVLLKGFGMEDAHAVGNSLTWGPDGWLYGAQGSTVTAHINGIEFQQGIWRYHPGEKKFELFSEGGGNTWGLDFDKHGFVIAGTNWGGTGMLHQMQGAYYVKTFGKHGELHNPYAFGYFEHLPYDKFIGGHVTCGGVLFQEDSFGERFRDMYIAGNLLSNVIDWHILEPKGSSFTAKRGGTLLNSHDPWFRPVDCAVGPDEALYVADWHDKRATHVDPIDDWDRTNGRIYRIARKAETSELPRDLHSLSAEKLLDLSEGRSGYHSRMARRLLAGRPRGETRKAVAARLPEDPAKVGLDFLWALYVTGGFDLRAAERWLGSPNEDVRAWVIRLAGDEEGEWPASFRGAAVQIAATDANPAVMAQLACTAKRRGTREGLEIFQRLALRPEAARDGQVPLLLWWALESKAESGRREILDLFKPVGLWTAPVMQEVVIERLARRYAAAGGEDNFKSLAMLMGLAPLRDDRLRLAAGMEKGFEGRGAGDGIPEPLRAPLERLWKEGEPTIELVRLMVRLGNARAREFALAKIKDRGTAEEAREAFIQVLGQAGGAGAEGPLLELIAPGQSEGVRKGALAALERFDSPKVTQDILAGYAGMNAALRTRARGTLIARPAGSRALMEAMDRAEIDPKEMGLDQLQRIALHEDAGLNKLMEKHWGKIKKGTEAEKLARIGGVVSVLGLRKGEPEKGHEVFMKACGVCHTLFDEGKKIGPELTGADRKNRDYMISNIVDPSGVIRPEYINYIAEAKDGRTLTGLLAESTPKTVTILDAQGEKTQLAREELKELRQSEVSLMPEALLDPLAPEEIQDLFAYLQSEGETRKRE